jgi:acyl-[acyl-carrier-protein] desaturase
VVSPKRLTARDLLRELEPTVRAGLDRHVAAATEWFPHEFVPYEQGRNYLEEPWLPSDSRLAAISQTALELNLLTEDNLPYYHLAIWDTFGREGAWGEWVRRWTAEEGRHAIVLRDYLSVTRGVDPVQLERGRMDQVCRGYYPEGSRGTFGHPLDGIAYATIQELATRISHRNTGTFTDDATVVRLTARIAVDENLHYVFYRELGKAALELDSSAMILAIRRQVIGFAMPGRGVPGYRRKVLEMARAGIYDSRIHLDQVLRPILLTHWTLDRASGLSDEAESARSEILGFLDRLALAASRSEAKRAVSRA